MLAVCAAVKDRRNGDTNKQTVTFTGQTGSVKGLGVGKVGGSLPGDQNKPWWRHRITNCVLCELKKFFLWNFQRFLAQ